MNNEELIREHLEDKCKYCNIKLFDFYNIGRLTSSFKNIR